MTTFVNLKTYVSRDIRDPSNKVFDTTAIGDIINSALAEIGRLAPARFQEDIDPILNTFEYRLQSAVFSSAVPEIEVSRVELWDVTQTPNAPLMLVAPGSGEYMNYSQTGWSVRDGVLEIPYRIVSFIGSSVADYKFRVWGYEPYVPLSADADVCPLSAEREQALRLYSRIEALQRLVMDRDMFTQWQTRAGNTDVSPASLMNALSIAQNEWRRVGRSITVLREAAG